MTKKKEDNHRFISRLLTVSQVAVLLNVHPNTIRKWSDTGTLKAYRLGSRRDRRFKPEDVDKLINISAI